MAKGEEPSKPRRRPAQTPEERERQLINASYDAAEQMISEGRATSQLLVHFLKLGTERETLENERLRRENQLLTAKVESLGSAKRVEELYAEAMNAFRSYQGRPDKELPDA